MTDSAPDAVHQSRAERRLAVRILLAIVAVLAVAVLAVFVFGVQAIGPLGLVLTVVVFAVILAFSAGR